MLKSRKRLSLYLHVVILELATVMTVTASSERALAGPPDDDSWKPQLEPALRKMEIFFSEIRASATVKKFTTLKGIPNWQYVETLQRSGGAYKSLTRVVEPKARAGESVYCRNPERYVFGLERAQDGSSFFAKYVLPNTAAIREVDDIFPCRYVLASHCVLGVPLAKIINDPSFLVKSVSLKDGTMVLKFDWSPPHETMPHLVFPSAELWFSVEKGWAIEKYRLAIGRRGSKGTLMEGTVEYDRIEDGVAVPKRIFEHYGSVGTEECIFEKVEHLASDKRDFTLSYYGLPEAIGLPTVGGGGSRWYLWLALAGIVCLALGLGLRQIMHRRAASS